MTAADPRREWRQLAALDRSGGGGVFSGRQNGALVQHLVEDDLVVAGNILANDRVLTQMMDGFHNGRGDLADRLLAALEAAQGGRRQPRPDVGRHADRGAGQANPDLARGL